MARIGPGIALSVLSAFLGALYLIPYRMAALEVPSETLALTMLFLGAVLNTAGLLFRRERRAGITPRATGAASLLLGIFSVTGNVCMAEALFRIGPGLASVVSKSQLIIVALLGVWFLRERISPRFVFGCLLAIGGFVIIRHPLSSAVDLKLEGMLWALFAALSFALMQVISRGFAAQIEPRLVNSLRLWVAVALLLLWNGARDLGGLTDLPVHIWLLATAAALAGPSLSRLALMHAVRHVPAAYSTLATMVSPIFAFSMEGIFFGTFPTRTELLGSLVLMVGVLLPVLELLRWGGSQRMGDQQRLR